jgi:hypothetical protein
MSSCFFDMNARKLSAGMQRGHIRSCKRFAAFLHRSPDTATTEDIRRFQLHLAEAGVRICNRNRIMTGLRFLFGVPLRRLDLSNEVSHIREPRRIPLVMSPDETRRLLAVAGSVKVRTLLSLGYGCGLRASEVVRLKVKHIDSARKTIRIAYCPASGAARTSGRDARIECDKQRRQGCAMTKVKRQVLCATRREPVDHAAPRYPSRLGFCHGRPKTKQWCSTNREKLFPKCELPHISQSIPERCCFQVGGSGRSSGECRLGEEAILSAVLSDVSVTQNLIRRGANRAPLSSPT